MKYTTLLLTGFLMGGQLFAQSSANPLSQGAKSLYQMAKNEVLKSAEEMPEENYSFKPIATVRSFGALVAHVADSQYEFCPAVLKDGKKVPGIEKTKTTKTDIIAALKTSFEYCDKAYNEMTDAQGAKSVDFFGKPSPELSILSFNTLHIAEHYGNMITYLRLKGLVPPSSQGQE